MQSTPDPPAAEANSRCQEWLAEIDVRHSSEQESPEVASVAASNAQQQLGDQPELSMTLSFATEASTDWKAKVQSLPTPLCLGLTVTIPQWSYVLDAKQCQFAVYHVACRRGSLAWEVRKRYSDFVLLDQLLRQQHKLALFAKARSKGLPQSRVGTFDPPGGRLSTEPVPPLPGRRLWRSTNRDIEAILRRCHALQAYLQELLTLPRPTQAFSPLNRFLSESNSSYLRVLSTSHIVNPDRDAAGKPHSGADAAQGTDRPTGASDLMRRLMPDPWKAKIRIEYPEWVQHEDFWSHEYHTDFDKMQLAIDISRKNVSFESGGPFGAAIFNKSTHRLVSVGMSLVEHGNNCCLHAEMVAVQMATTLLRSHTLDRDPEVQHELFSSSEPCAMCIGATLWCGVQKLVCAATDVDVRSLLHDTGPVFEESFRYLQSKGIHIKRKFLRSDAKQVLCEYSAVRTSAAGRQV